jgi:uracil-DNA glycosylase family 4
VTRGGVGSPFSLPLVKTYEEHVARWKDCTRCELHEERNLVCLTRGSLPCDVLFVGEAPGKNEDAMGSPFVGPAGQYQEAIIKHARLVEMGFSYAFTNVVACIPWETERVTTKDPPKSAIDACRPRLEEALVLADMLLLVTLGATARKVFTSTLKSAIKLPPGTRMIHLVHPAEIVRADMARKETATRRAVVQLQDALEELAEFLKKGG